MGTSSLVVFFEINKVIIAFCVKKCYNVSSILCFFTRFSRGLRAGIKSKEMQDVAHLCESWEE